MLPLWGCSPYGDPPLQDLDGPSKEALLSVPDFIMFGHTRTIHIPPPGSRFSLPCSPPEQVVKAVELEPPHFFA